MKKIQFALEESKYKQAKKRLKEHGLSWQKVCDQMTDFLLISENVDEFGLPLSEMSPSIFKRARAEIEGHFETAAQKYIQIFIVKDKRNENHWKSGLMAALKQVIKSNRRRSFNRGYVFNKEELEEIFNEMWVYGKKLAAGHLDISENDIQVNKPSLNQLFNFVGMDFLLK